MYTHGLTRIDVEILQIISGLADQVAHKFSNELDFVDLFKAFDAFMEANSLTPARYPNYFTCMNVIVNLCNFNGPSWSDRMSAYLKNYSANEIRKENHKIMREKLHGFDLKTKERFLSLWYESYVFVSERDQIGTEFASTRNYVHSIRNPFFVWRKKLEILRAQDEQVQISRDSKLKQRALALILNRARQVKQNYSKADLALVGHRFDKWRSRHITVTKNTAKATQICEQNTKQHVMELWDEAKTEREVLRSYNHRIVSKALSVWAKRAKKVLEETDIAVTGHSQDLLSRGLSQWVQHLSLVENMDVKAQKMADRLALSHAFAAWKRRTVYDEIYFDFEARREYRVQKAVLDAWRLRTLQIKEARRFRDFMSCYTHLKAWRLQTRLSQLQTSKNQKTASKFFNMWRLEQKAVIFTRMKDSQLAYDALTHWQDRVQTIKDSVNRNYVEFQITKNSRLVQSVLHIWREKLQAQNDKAVTASNMYNQVILKQAFDSVLAGLETIASNEEIAVAQYSKNKKSQFFAYWRDTLHLVREERREALLENYVREKNAARQRKVLTLWLNKSLEVEDLNAQCDALISQRQRACVQKFFGSWSKQSLDIARNIRLADARFEQARLEETFDKWKSAKYELDSLESQAQSVLYSSDLQKLERVYRVWRMRMFKLKTKRRDADDFHQRLLDLRFRTIWRYWKLKTQDIRAEQSFIHQKNIMASARKGGLASTGGLQKRVQMSLPAKAIPMDSFADFEENASEYRQDYVLETPTRARIRKPIPMTSLGRWRRNKTPGVTGLDLSVPPQPLSPTEGR